MIARETDSQDPFVLLSDLARQPCVNRTVLELAIRAGKLTVISRHGRKWVLRAAANEWLSWRAANCSAPTPIHQFDL